MVSKTLATKRRSPLGRSSQWPREGMTGQASIASQICKELCKAAIVTAPEAKAAYAIELLSAFERYLKKSLV